MEGFVLINLSKYIRWRALLNRVISKQQSQREKTHPVCLTMEEKYKKMGSVITQNDYKTTSKTWTDKKKKDLFFVVCVCV